ncbi:MAG: hypothetical protein ABMA64_37340 [Myxococcota bacterium]
MPTAAGADSWITIREGGTVETRIGHCTESGASLGVAARAEFLSAVARLPLLTHSNSFPRSGAVVDLEARSLVVWCTGIRRGSDRQLREGWPGWRVIHVRDHFEGHLGAIVWAPLPVRPSRSQLLELIRVGLARWPDLAHQATDPELRPLTYPSARWVRLTVRWPDGKEHHGAFPPEAFPAMVAAGETLLPEHLGVPPPAVPPCGELLLDRQARVARFWVAEGPLAADRSFRVALSRFVRPSYAVDTVGPNWHPDHEDPSSATPDSGSLDPRPHYAAYVEAIQAAWPSLGAPGLKLALVPPPPDDDAMLRSASWVLGHPSAPEYDWRLVLTSTCPPSLAGAERWARLFPTPDSRAQHVRWLERTLDRSIVDRDLFPTDDFPIVARLAYRVLAPRLP